MSLRQTRNKSTQSSKVAIRVADIYEFLRFCKSINSINQLRAISQSVALKIRLALFEKSVEPFHTIFRLEAVDLKANFLIQGCRQCDAVSVWHRIFGISN